jgi:hypothetical protein
MMELRRITNFLLDDPAMHVPDSDMRGRASTHYALSSVADEVLECASRDAQMPYRSITTGADLLYSLMYFSADQVRYIVKELGGIMYAQHQVFSITA